MKQTAQTLTVYFQPETIEGKTVSVTIIIYSR